MFTTIEPHPVETSIVWTFKCYSDKFIAGNKPVTEYTYVPCQFATDTSVCLSVYEMKCVTLHAARSGDGHFYQRGNECLNCSDSSKEAPRGRGEGEGPTSSRTDIGLYLHA